MDQGRKGPAHRHVCSQGHYAVWESPTHDSSPQRLSKGKLKKKIIHPQSIIYRLGAFSSLSLEAPDSPLTPLSLSLSIAGITEPQYSFAFITLSEVAAALASAALSSVRAEYADSVRSERLMSPQSAWATSLWAARERHLTQK